MHKNKYGTPMPDGYTDEDIDQITALALASVQKEDIATFGNSYEDSLRRDIVRWVLIEAKKLKDEYEGDWKDDRWEDGMIID